QQQVPEGLESPQAVPPPHPAAEVERARGGAPPRVAPMGAGTIPALQFLAALLVDGALAGTIYALVALAFVVVYKSSRMVNFALGEWMMLAATFVAAGVHVFGLGLAAALMGACAGMVVLGLAFNRVVLRPLVGG